MQTINATMAATLSPTGGDRVRLCSKSFSLREKVTHFPNGIVHHGLYVYSSTAPLVLPKTLSRLTYFYDPLIMFLYDKKGQCLCYSPDFMSK